MTATIVLKLYTNVSEQIIMGNPALQSHTEIILETIMFIIASEKHITYKLTSIIIY